MGDVSSPGVFNQHLVQYSESTKNFIKELIREAKVNANYQRRIEKNLSRNEPLEPLKPSWEKPPASSRGPEATTPSGDTYFEKAKWSTKRPRETIRKLSEAIPENIYVPPPPIIDEIKERLEWMSAMDDTGAGEEYKSLMNTQIALRLRDIEFLDEKKAYALKRLYFKDGSPKAAEC